MTGPTENDTDASDDSGKTATGRSSRFDDLVEQIDEDDDDSQRPETEADASETADSPTESPPTDAVDSHDAEAATNADSQRFDNNEGALDTGTDLEIDDTPAATDDMPAAGDQLADAVRPADEEQPRGEAPPIDGEEQPPSGPSFMEQSRQRTTPSGASLPDKSLSLRRKIQIGLFVLFAAILLVSLAVELTA